MNFRPFLFYPVLAAVYPVLALAAQNFREGLEPADLAGPLVLSVTLALVAWILSRLLSADVHVRGVLTLSAVAFFAGYGLLVDLISMLGWGSPFHLHLSTFLLGLLAFAGLFAWSRLARRDLALLTRYLNATLVILLSFPLVSIGLNSLRQSLAPDLTNLGGAPLRAAENPEHLPDIYLLVMDAYTSSGVLLDSYGFDNRRFEEALEARGFTIPRESRANYVATFLSLAALLNWQYLDEIPAAAGADSRDRGPAYRLMEDNRAALALKDLGYRFVFVGSAYPPLNGNRNADLQLDGGGDVEFELVWVRSTALQGALRVWCGLTNCGKSGLPFSPEDAEANERKFDDIAALASRDDPTFVLAHFLVPHEPLIYDSNCGPRDPFWPEQVGVEEVEVFRRGYPEQVQCVNRKLLELVDHLLQNSDDPPIILIQSDHGLGAFPLGRPIPLAQATPAQVRDRTSVFAAYHLPDGGGAGVYDSMSAVNLFPLVFNHYFGTDIPFLPDETYWSTFERPFDFERIH